MAEHHITNFHVTYPDVLTQHWHPNSESYAGVDNLITFLEQGWDIARCVETRHWYAGQRSICIYRFYLERDAERLEMPVINNPYVMRIIKQLELDVEGENDDANQASIRSA